MMPPPSTILAHDRHPRNLDVFLETWRSHTSTVLSVCTQKRLLFCHDSHLPPMMYKLLWTLSQANPKREKGRLYTSAPDTWPTGIHVFVSLLYAISLLRCTKTSSPPITVLGPGTCKWPTRLTSPSSSSNVFYWFEVLVSIWAGLNAALSFNFHILGSQFHFAIVKLGEASCQKKKYELGNHILTMTEWVFLKET
jgi:hypothetical protein